LRRCSGIFVDTTYRIFDRYFVRKKVDNVLRDFRKKKKKEEEKKNKKKKKEKVRKMG
jgi:hypothetical protein